MPLNHFDIISSFYDRWGRFEKSHPLYKLIDLPANGIILDIGGGTGRVASILTGSDRWVVVMDISSGMLRKARNKTGLLPLMADAAVIPLKTGSVDRVIIVDALHHIKRQRETIQEFCRLLKPAGVGVVVEPDVHSLFVKLIIIMEFLLMMGSHFLNEHDLLKLFVGEPGSTVINVWRGNLIVRYLKNTGK